ncbi:MAG: hypothetical protein ACRC7N_19260 [Clostridium sp.]
MADNNNSNNDNSKPINKSGPNPLEIDETFEGLDEERGSASTRAQGATGQGSANANATGANPNNLEELILRLNAEITALNNAQIQAQTLGIDQSGKIFFDAKVRPFVDTMYFLSLSSSSVAASAQIFSNNPLLKKKEAKKSLELSMEINKEIRCIFETFRKRMKQYRCGVEQELGCCKGRCKDCDIHKEYEN